jgi:hypothetical protein
MPGSAQGSRLRAQLPGLQKWRRGRERLWRRTWLSFVVVGEIGVKRYLQTLLGSEDLFE